MTRRRLRKLKKEKSIYPAPFSFNFCCIFYVYIIKSKKIQKIYIGYSPNLKARIIKHNTNKVFSTKNKGPWELIYYEAYKSEVDAKERERQLKYYGNALAQLKRRIKGSLNPAPFLK